MSSKIPSKRYIRNPITCRPNPVCLATVKLVKKKEDILKVKGLDAIDGTPIIDIKPYLPSHNTSKDVSLPAWMKKFLEYFFEFELNYDQYIE